MYLKLRCFSFIRMQQLKRLKINGEDRVGIGTGYKLFQGHLPSIKIVNTNPLDLTLPLLGIPPTQVHKDTH